MDKVIIPIHTEQHWCLAVINLKEKRFEYYDSLRDFTQNCLDVCYFDFSLSLSKLPLTVLIFL